MNDIEFTEDMHEVSGLGGFYERCCRTGVVAGARWLADHPGLFPDFRDVDAFAVDLPAKALESAIRDAPVTYDDDRKSILGDELTSAQWLAIVHHVSYIATHGWKKYREYMTGKFSHYNEKDQSNERTV